MPDERLVAAAVITRGQEVLISRRLDGRPPWAFVAGTIEAGETPQAAAVREVAEETGMTVTAGLIMGQRTHPATGRVIVYVTAVPLTGSADRPVAALTGPGPHRPGPGRSACGHACRKASRSALIVSACVVGMPCGKPL
jgi:8-oxo-dGTP pyrophosphatase MutT (NUDIX family)